MVVDRPALADPIPIGNHSFEDAALGDGVWSDCIDVACGEPDPDIWVDNPLNGVNAFAEVVAGFASEGTHHLAGFMAMDIDYYEITSASGSLNPAGWNSLQDQDYEGNGPPGNCNGSGNGTS